MTATAPTTGSERVWTIDLAAHEARLTRLIEECKVGEQIDFGKLIGLVCRR